MDHLLADDPLRSGGHPQEFPEDNHTISASINQRSDVGCAEAVVDIDDAHVRSTGVEHAEKGCESIERGAVADAGRNGDNRNSNEASDDAGQSAFHARADDDDPRLREHAAVGEKAMDAGDSDIVERLDFVAHQFGGDNRLFSDGNVAGSSGDDCDDALIRLRAAISAARRVVAAKGDTAGERAIFGRGDLGRNGVELFFGGAGGEDVGVGVMGGEAGEDLRDLRGCFSLAEDDLRHSVAQRPMMVEFGEAQVFEGQMAKARESFVGGELTGADISKQLA